MGKNLETLSYALTSECGHLWEVTEKAKDLLPSHLLVFRFSRAWEDLEICVIYEKEQAGANRHLVEVQDSEMWQDRKEMEVKRALVEWTPGT